MRGIIIIADAMPVLDLGYFGYNASRGAYIEVISYNKLVKNAKKRNQVLFDKLFRPKADQLIVLTGN